MTSSTDEPLHILDIAEYLQLPAPLIEHLRCRSLLPAQEVGGRWNFDRAEVDRWIDLGMPGWHPEDLRAVAAVRREARVSLATALQRGTVLLDLPVADARECLQRAVGTLDLPSSIDRTDLIKRLLTREQLCSTALDNGVAIPHTSRTGLRIVPHNVVAFVRTARPIAFGAPAGSLTDLLFLVLAADQLAHLVLLARVACLIKFPLMGRALRVAATPGEVLELVDRAEQWSFDRPPDENR